MEVFPVSFPFLFLILSHSHVSFPNLVNHRHLQNGPSSMLYKEINIQKDFSISGESGSKSML
jgi:hypothetical protein